MKITKIQASWKKEGYVFVATEDGSNSRLRKVYPRKTGVFKGLNLINLDTQIYSFKWDAQEEFGLNITHIGTYKSVGEAEKAHEKPIVEIEVPEVMDGEARHEKFNQILACIESDIPVYLYGPAGSGKNHTLKQIADVMDLDFYFTNSVQQEYKLTGFIDAGGKFHETEFYKAFKDGGIFFLDEMDASIPEVLVLLNAAIANKYFEFPVGKIDAHEDFRVVAAGNTVGNGASEEYTGRLQLDQATLDRFSMIEFNYSPAIENALAKGNKALLEFVRGLRKQAEEQGIRATFSYRCITMVTKLEGKMALKEIIEIAVLKGLDADTARTFRRIPGNKYSEAM